MQTPLISRAPWPLCFAKVAAIFATVMIVSTQFAAAQQVWRVFDGRYLEPDLSFNGLSLVPISGGGGSGGNTIQPFPPGSGGDGGIVPLLSGSVNFSWIQDSEPASPTNEWSVPPNWSPITSDGGPSAAGTFVLIGNNISANRAITLFNTGDGGTATKTVGRLDIGDTNGSNTFTIAPGNSSGVLNFDGSGANAQLNELSTSLGDTISAPVTLTTSLDITNASANTLTISGGITAVSGTQTITTSTGNVLLSGIIGNGGGVVAVVQNGPGTLTLSNANTYTGSTTLTTGTLSLGSSSILSAGAIVSGPVGKGTFNIGSGTNAATLSTNAATTRTVQNNISLDGDVTFTPGSGQTTGRIALDTATGLIAANMTLTRTNQLTVDTGETVDFIGAITGSTFGITKLGAGTLNLGNGSATDLNPNTFIGLTTVSAGLVNLRKAAGVDAFGGNLQINGGTVALGNNNQINNGSALTLNGGTLKLSNATTGFQEGTTGSAGVGALTLSSSSIIDMAFTSLLHVAASGGQSWSGTLSIWNWSGTLVTGGGAEQLLFGTDTTAASLTQTQLNEISFYSDGGTTFLGTGAWATSINGEVVPVPEPSTWLGGALAVGFLGWSQRKRFARLAAIKSRLVIR